MKNPRIALSLLASSLAIFSATSQAADVVKAANADALNLGTSWTGGIAPTSSDVAVWNNTVTAANATVLGANTSWQGIKIANPGEAVTINGSAGPATLTLGSSGIDMSAATQNLTFGSTIPVTLAANQTWNIGTGRLLTYGASAATSIDLNGMTLDTSGAGSITIANRYSLTSATAAIINVNNTQFSFESGGSTAVSIGANITTNVAAGKVFQLRGNSGSGGVGITSNGVVNVNGGIFRIVSSNTVQINQTGKVNMSGTSEIDNQYGNNSANSRLQLSGGLNVTGTMTWKESNTSATATIFNSALTGNGTINFQNTSATAGRRADWSGNNSAFTGTVNINGGSGNRNLRLTSATAGSASATWAPAAGNILEIHGVAVNLGTLNGAGTVTNSHATNVAGITVGAGSFSGVITNGTPTNGMTLTKTGSGVLALSGANTYSGFTDVQGGTLNTTTSQTGGGAVTVADTATFGVTQLTDGSTFNSSEVTLGSATGANLTLTGAAAPSAAILTTTSLTVNGASKIILMGNPVVNTTLVDYSGSIGGAGFAGLTLVTPIRTTGTLFHDTTNTSIKLDSYTSDTLKWQGNVNNTWDIDTTNSGAGSGATANWKTTADPSGAYYVEAGLGLIDAPVFDDTATGTTSVSLNTTVAPLSVTFDNSSKNYSVTGSGAIAGLTGITKNGTGALTLGTANTFSGGVQHNAGTLNVNHANALGTGTLNVAAGTTLDNTSGSAKVATNAQNWNGDFTFTGTNDLTLGSATMNANRQVTVNAGKLTVAGVGGAYSLTKAGAGNLTINGAANYNGGTTVTAGRLTLVNTKTGSANFATDGDLEFNLTSGQQINGGTFSGTGNLIKSGSGVLQFGASGSPQVVALTGDNSVIYVEGGVLRNEYFNSGFNSGNKAGLNVSSGAVFDVWDGNTTVDELNGSGTINKGWSSNTTLTIGNNNGSGNFTGTILNNASLGYGGSSGGALSFIKQGSGTQTLSGTNTYIGSTTISGGTLALGATGTIDNTSGVSLGTAGTFDVSAKSGSYSVKNLTGSGNVIGSLTITNMLAAGNSPGTINVSGDLTVGASTTYAFEMTGGSSTADLVDVGGSITLGGATLDLIELGTYTVGDKFTLFAYDGTLTGTFTGLSDDSTFFDDLSNEWLINYNDTSAGLHGGIGTSFATITAVPETSSSLLTIIGSTLLVLRRRRRTDLHS